MRIIIIILVSLTCTMRALAESSYSAALGVELSRDNVHQLGALRVTDATDLKGAQLLVGDKVFALGGDLLPNRRTSATSILSRATHPVEICFVRDEALCATVWEPLVGAPRGNEHTPLRWECTTEQNINLSYPTATFVDPVSPASYAGLKRGDAIIRINGDAATPLSGRWTENALAQIVRDGGKLMVRRGGSTVGITIPSRATFDADVRRQNAVAVTVVNSSPFTVDYIFAGAHFEDVPTSAWKSIAPGEVVTSWVRNPTPDVAWLIHARSAKSMQPLVNVLYGDNARFVFPSADGREAYEVQVSPTQAINGGSVPRDAEWTLMTPLQRTGNPNHQVAIITLKGTRFDLGLSGASESNDLALAQIVGESFSRYLWVEANRPQTGFAFHGGFGVAPDDDPLSPGITVSEVVRYQANGFEHPLNPGDRIIKIDGDCLIMSTQDAEWALVRHGWHPAYSVEKPIAYTIVRDGKELVVYGQIYLNLAWFEAAGWVPSPTETAVRTAADSALAGHVEELLAFVRTFEPGGNTYDKELAQQYCRTLLSWVVNPRAALAGDILGNLSGLSRRVVMRGVPVARQFLNSRSGELLWEICENIHFNSAANGRTPDQIRSDAARVFGFTVVAASASHSITSRLSGNRLSRSAK